jgi:hypothetical protein
VVPLRTFPAGNGARAHGARAKAGTQSFFLSFTVDLRDRRMVEVDGVGFIAAALCCALLRAGSLARLTHILSEAVRLVSESPS